MEPVKDILNGIMQEVQKNHEVAVERLAKEGKHIGLERIFRREIEKRYGVKGFAFTDQERGHLSHLVADLGAENVGPFLVDAVARWKDLVTEEYLKYLPPTPVFKDLFWNRQKIQAGIISLQKREERRVEPIVQRKLEEAKAEEPQGERKSPLMEMFLKERERQRAERAVKT